MKEVPLKTVREVCERIADWQFALLDKNLAAGLFCGKKEL